MPEILDSKRIGKLISAQYPILHPLNIITDLIHKAQLLF